jgi:hypothetical protein
MDGSSLGAPSGVAVGHFSGPDALFRVVYYGEALRAMTEHVSDSLITGACGPMLELLDGAFDRFSEAKESFSPEEFTLYVLSLMLNLCEDAEEARQFRIGAARYIVRSAPVLPEGYGPIVEDARKMLRTADGDMPAVEGPAAPPEPEDGRTSAAAPVPQAGATVTATLPLPREITRPEAPAPIVPRMAAGPAPARAVPPRRPDAVRPAPDRQAPARIGTPRSGVMMARIMIAVLFAVIAILVMVYEVNLTDRRGGPDAAEIEFRSLG